MALSGAAACSQHALIGTQIARDWSVRAPLASLIGRSATREAVTEAGLEPNSWQMESLDDVALLEFLAGRTRQAGQFPTYSEMQLWKRSDPSLPHPSVLRSRFGKKEQQLEALLVFAQTTPGYADVAAIIGAATTRTPELKTKTTQIVVGAMYLMRMADYYKIGKSNDPGRRSHELGIKLPEKHDLVHVIETDDPSGIEAYWHKRFGRKQTNGEWYALSPDDVAAFMRRAYM